MGWGEGEGERGVVRSVHRRQREVCIRGGWGNIGGLAAAQLSIFLGHVGMAAPWDFIALQGGFRVLEGLDGGGHGVFTPPELEGGLRCPVVVVHSRRAESARYVG